MKVTLMPITWNSSHRFEKVKDELEIRGRNETIQTSAEYWEESWRPEQTFYHSDSSERSSANTDAKNSQGEW